MQADVIVVAAGKGERMGTALPKPFLSLLGTPLFVHTLRAITTSALVRQIILVIAKDREAFSRELLQIHGPFSVPVSLVYGGSERQDSVRCGLAALDSNSELVAIHDAARPFLTANILDVSFRTAAEYGGAVVAVPTRDTIKRVSGSELVIETVPRQHLWLAQTPQAFQVPLIRDAHARAAAAGIVMTDDAALLEWNGNPVKVVVGSQRNFKITTPEDLELAEMILTVELHRKK